jgi:drug/metabolite transporter (DMT)-like permease
MSPFVYAFLAFVLTIANRLLQKHILFKVDGFALGLIANILGALILFPFVYVKLSDIQNLSYGLLGLIVLTQIFWTYVTWAGNISVAQNDFSFKEMIRQTRIIWVVLAGVFLLGEKLHLSDVVGIGLILVSVYIISWKTVSLRSHISSKPILLAWSIAVMGAVITIMEKTILNSTSVLLYVFISYVLVSIFLALFLTRLRIKKIQSVLNTHLLVVLVSSIVMVLTYYTTLKAYQLLPISIAFPLIQSSTVVGVLIGTFLFEENKGWKQKAFAALVAVSGVLIIRFF